MPEQGNPPTGNPDEESIFILKTKEIRLKYLARLGEIFHHQGHIDLARLSLNPKYQDLVKDYVRICLPEFQKEYQEEVSRLEQEAQSLSKSAGQSPSVFGSQGDHGPFGKHPHLKDGGYVHPHKRYAQE